MTEYLLIAEADQIQDFIFRAAHLSEVVGGSQLLTRFCEEIPRLLDKQADVLVNGGGKFVLVFKDETAARGLGDQLAEAYQRVADGTLTVAEPVPIDEQLKFGEVLRQAEKRLREAKNSSSPATGTTVHLPYIALCGSCGAGLAVTHSLLFEGKDPTERPNYLCRACQTKVIERKETAKDFRQDDFFRPFVNLVGAAEDFDWTTRPRHVSEYDPRRYVAYLVADGNNMGQVLEECQNRQLLRNFSKEMKKALHECLARPTKKIKEQTTIEGFKIPVLPLILGGDDVFALLPAPWALSFAQEFCRAYEDIVGKIVQEVNPNTRATVSAAVIICKETYPHTLAHKAGMERLKQAKRLSKSVQPAKSVSAVGFELVTGTHVTSTSSDKKYRRTLGPYFVSSQDDLPENLGLSLHRLIDQRWQLRHLPGKRRAQLRQLFDRLPQPQTSLPEWTDELGKLQQRITERNETQGKWVDEALTDLGSDQKDKLFFVARPYEREFSGHGLPDLLQVWDFAFDLDRRRSDYEE